MIPTRRTVRTARAACALALAGLCGHALAASSTPAPPDTRLVEVLGGLTDPVAVRHAGDERLFVVQQGGEIRIVDGGTLLPNPFLTIDGDSPGGFTSGGERGLLGLAFHPDYAGNGRFFVYYTDGGGDTVVVEFAVSGNPDIADPQSGEIVLAFEQDFSNHNGGDIHFGPDGYLYIALGDGGSGGDPNNRAQSLDTLLGKILRIDVDADDQTAGMCGYVGGYAIPADNPYAGDDGACDEIWHYGLRNPYRFSFDAGTGDMLIGDVGQGDFEEISYQPAGAANGGRDFGWRFCEGFHGFNGATDEECASGAAGRAPPVIEYGRDFGFSVTGGFVYRGPSGGLDGTYLYADFGSGRMFAARPEGDTPWLWRQWKDAPFNPSGFGEGADGRLYVVAYGGALHEIVSDSIFRDGAE